MGKFERSFVIFSLLYIMIYSLFFLNAISSPDTFQNIIPFHLFGMVLSLGLFIVVLRDIVKRSFKNPNSKVFWSILILMFWPAIFIYFPKYAFRPRDETEEPEGSKKLISAFITAAVLFFGYMGFSMYSTIQNFENNFEHQSSSLSSLAAAGDNETIEKLLDSDTNLAISIDGEGSWSPLHSASHNNHPATVQLLLDYGADIDKQSNCNGNTPLHTAASMGHVEVVKVLLDAGADTTLVNDENKTAEDLASEGGYPVTAEYLTTHTLQNP